MIPTEPVVSAGSFTESHDAPEWMGCGADGSWPGVAIGNRTAAWAAGLHLPKIGLLETSQKPGVVVCLGGWLL